MLFDGVAVSQQLAQLRAFVSGSGLLNIEEGIGLEDAFFGVDAELVLPEVALVYDGEAEGPVAIILASVLDLLLDLDTPRLELSVVLLEADRLSA